MNPILLAVALFVAGFSVGCIAMDYFVVQKQKKAHRLKMEEALSGWVQALMVAAKLAHHEKQENNKEGKIISPIQIPREGS